MVALCSDELPGTEGTPSHLAGIQHRMNVGPDSSISDRLQILG